MVDLESCRTRIDEERIERVSATGSETDDQPTRRGGMACHGRNCRAASLSADERYYVPGGHDHVESVTDDLGGQLQIFQICMDPGCTGVHTVRLGDQDRIQVDTDDDVTKFGKPSADATRAATGVEDPGVTWDHRIDQARFSVQVVALFRHLLEPFYVTA